VESEVIAKFAGLLLMLVFAYAGWLSVMERR